MGKKLQLLILFAGALLLSGCVPSYTVPAETPRSTPVVLPDGTIAIGARELVDYFHEDEAAANARFKGKILEVTGPVGASNRLFDEHYIILGGSKFVWTSVVQCYFSDSSDSRLNEVSRGDTVRVRGECEGLVMDVLLKDCQLVASEKNN